MKNYPYYLICIYAYKYLFLYYIILYYEGQHDIQYFNSCLDRVSKLQFHTKCTISKKYVTIIYKELFTWKNIVHYIESDAHFFSPYGIINRNI